MDVVYPVKVGSYDELRYSLRSLENFQHDRVVLSGYVPDWVTNVLSIGRKQDHRTTAKWMNSCRNIMAAVESPLVSDPFVLFNDDFYAIRPTDGTVHFNAGDLRHQVMQMKDKGYHYQSGAACALQGILEAGYKHPLSYMLHVPLVVFKEQWVRAWELAQQSRKRLPTYAWHMRTWYGNVAGLGGHTIVDVKIRETSNFYLPVHAPYLSTNYQSFMGGKVGDWVRREFSRACVYERD